MKNIYVILDKIKFEEKCKREMDLFKKDPSLSYEPMFFQNFIFSIVQEFYTEVIKDELNINSETAIAFSHWICSQGYDSKQICVRPVWSQGYNKREYTSAELFDIWKDQILNTTVTKQDT